MQTVELIVEDVAVNSDDWALVGDEWSPSSAVTPIFGLAEVADGAIELGQSVSIDGEHWSDPMLWQSLGIGTSAWNADMTWPHSQLYARRVSQSSPGSAAFFEFDTNGAEPAGSDSFVFSWNGADSAALPGDIALADLETAINAIATIIAAGGVVVSDAAMHAGFVTAIGRGFRVTFNDPGARANPIFAGDIGTSTGSEDAGTDPVVGVDGTLVRCQLKLAH